MPTYKCNDDPMNRTIEPPLYRPTTRIPCNSLNPASKWEAVYSSSSATSTPVQAVKDLTPTPTPTPSPNGRCVSCTPDPNPATFKRAALSAHDDQPMIPGKESSGVHRENNPAISSARVTDTGYIPKSWWPSSPRSPARKLRRWFGP